VSALGQALIAQLDADDLRELARLVAPYMPAATPAGGQTGEGLLTAQEAAELVEAHVETIRRAVRRGDLPALKVGRELRIRTVDLEAWLARHEPAGKPERSRARPRPWARRTPMAEALARLDDR
jgi:excisionase family DNA binding protein